MILPRFGVHLWRLWLLLVLLAMAPRPAYGQPVEQARLLEEQARVAYEAKEYDRAADLFSQAYGLVPNALTKYNEARAWSAAGKLAPEADAHAVALSLTTLDPAFADYSRQRMVELDKILGALVLTEPAGAQVTVAHASGRTAPCRIHLPPGRYDVRIEPPAGVARTLGVEVIAGRTAQLFIPTDEPPSPSQPEPRPAAEPEPTGNEAHSVAGWACLGTGGALGVVATVLGIRTLGAVDDFEASGNTDADLRDEAVALRTWTNVATIAAVVVGGTGFVLLLTAPESEGVEAEAATIHVGPTLGGFAGTAAVRW